VSDIIAQLQSYKLIPVITMHDIDHALPLADCLIAAGLPVMEITLRTSQALACLKLIRQKRPEVLAGAGTILNMNLAVQSIDVGAQFLISPGLNAGLKKLGPTIQNTPYLPGVSTISEVMEAQEAGFRRLKFFPADISGGVPMLKNLSNLFSDLQFCPTGGIQEHALTNYLSVKNVFAVGGSWLTPDDKMKNQDWATITDIVRSSVGLIPRP
jgi:2-dehydro-3-deoxyphosphogluconate aldolase/(4S)-4-hydroxy-2-oxoglutarate aldolase